MHGGVYMNPVQVSQINYYIEEHLRTDPVLRKIRVIGEVANLKKTSQWAFFHLKDENALLACVSFEPLPDEIKDGNIVIASGAVRFYSKRGTLRLQVTEIAIENPLERTKLRQQEESRMRKLGWFDRQRSFPAYPSRIGLITSKDGAAIDDVRQNLARRFPFATLVVIPIQVQGVKAPLLIEKAFKRAKEVSLDCIILTRGGGDTSDLEVFDDSRVVEAIYSSPIPVVAAIGHEKDWSFAELAADARASTPTGAAEFIVPTRWEIRNRLRERLWKSNHLFERYFQKKTIQLQEMDHTIYQSISSSIEQKKTSLFQEKRMASQSFLNHLKVKRVALLTAQDTELKIENTWSSYRFYLQNQAGSFVQNDSAIPAGTYIIYGNREKQLVHVPEEEDNGIL